jgi:enoyl-CoA hydratase
MSNLNVVPGQIRTELHGHVLKIVIDNAAKKNSFSPQMMDQMSEALTLLDRTDDYWAGVVCAEGANFTAGLDMPKFFGPAAVGADKARRGGWWTEGKIDVFGLQNRCRKPIVTAVQGMSLRSASKLCWRAISQSPPTTADSANWRQSAA